MAGENDPLRICNWENSAERFMPAAKEDTKQDSGQGHPLPASCSKRRKLKLCLKRKSAGRRSRFINIFLTGRALCGILGGVSGN